MSRGYSRGDWLLEFGALAPDRNSVVRKLARTSTAVVFLFLAGCGFDDGRDLQPVVEQAMPSGSHLLAPCSHTDGLIDYPSHGCMALVKGDGAGVTQAIATALAREGFRVACPAAGSLVAIREHVRVAADVTQWGSFRGSAITAGAWRPLGSHPIPRGSVALRIDASRLSDSSAGFYRTLIARGGRCDRPLPKPSPVLQCVAWWNGPVGRTTREAVPWRTAGPDVEVVGHNREGESACSYTIRNGRGFLRLTARFDGDWHWPPLRPVSRRKAFRPNARLHPGDELLEAPAT
jgi:hypothetical protein